MLQNCTAARYQTNKERMVRISEYSREMFRRFEAQTGMNFEGRKKKGRCRFSAKPKKSKRQNKTLPFWNDTGRTAVWKPEECAEFEPALARYRQNCRRPDLPADATGDCHLFTQNLYKLCQEKAYSFISTKPSAASTTTGCASAQWKPKQNGLKQMPRLRARLLPAGLCWRSWISICPFIPSKRLFLDPACHKLRWRTGFHRFR